MLNKLVIAVSTTIILTAANALILWITKKVESSDKPKRDDRIDDENPKRLNA